MTPDFCKNHECHRHIETDNGTDICVIAKMEKEEGRYRVMPVFKMSCKACKHLRKLDESAKAEQTITKELAEMQQRKGGEE